MTKGAKSASLIAVALLALMTLLVFHGVIFRPGAVYGQDTIVQGYPLTWFESHTAGWSSPGWFPYMMSGFPMTSSRILPSNWTTFVLPVTRAITWRYILHTFAAAALMFLMLRRFGRGNSASVVGGMAFGFSAFFISKIYAGHGAALCSGVWIPLTFVLLDKTIDTKRPKYAVLTGAAFGLQILGQHPQYVYYSLLAAALFTAWRILPGLVRERQPRVIVRYAALAAVVAIFAVLISAVHLLPFAQMTALSNRGGGTGYEFASSLSLKPAQIITAAVPSFWGSPTRNNSVFGALYWDGAMYIGVIPLILAIAAVFGVRDSRASYFNALAIISLIIALGDHTPLFRLIYHLPGFDMIRAPSKILYLYTFAAAALAAYGLDLLLTSVPRLNPRRHVLSGPEPPFHPPLVRGDRGGSEARIGQRRVEFVFLISLIIIFLLLATLIVGHGAIFSHARRTIDATRPDAAEVTAKLGGLLDLQLSSVAWSAVFALVGTAAVMAVMRKLVSLRMAAAVMIVLSFTDLWMYASPLLYTTNTRKAYTSSDRRAIDIVKSDHERFRILPMNTSVFQYAQGVFDGLESVNGYYPVSLARYAAYVGAIEGKPAYVTVNADITNYDSPLVDLLSVKYVLSKTPLKAPNLEEVYAGRTYVYRNTNALPRAFTVHNAAFVPTPEAALRGIKSRNFDPREIVIIEAEKSLRPADGDASRDRVRIIEHSPTSIRLAAEMGREGYVFLSEVNYPGWRATIDGKPAEIHNANYLFRAVRVPKGPHEVRMEFVSPPYRVGLVLSILATAFIIGMLVQREGFGIQGEETSDELKVMSDE